MQNQNKNIMSIDETSKGRQGIKEMIDRMFSKEESGCTSKEKSDKKREIA